MTDRRTIYATMNISSSGRSRTTLLRIRIANDADDDISTSKTMTSNVDRHSSDNIVPSYRSFTSLIDLNVRDNSGGVAW